MADDAAMKMSIKMPSFYGQKKNWYMFWTRFRAYAGVQNFILALKETKETEMSTDEATVIDVTTDPEKASAAAKKKLQ